MRALTGLVVARFRRHVTVEAADGSRQVCQLQKRRLDPVVGDQINWVRTADEGVVTAVLARSTCLERIDKRGRAEVVAANLTQLVVVVAPRPAPDWLLVDRYLCAAALARLKGLVVFNKTDSLPDPAAPERQILEIYRLAGYQVLETSAVSGHGLAPLTLSMQAERSALVGQSGVGKSSLINALIGAALQDVGVLIGKGRLGQHTTTTAVLYRLPAGGELIDSPGVRGYSPPLDEPERLAGGFKEFEPLLGHCRFADCRHLVEPGCAIKGALARGTISARRYASYASLYALSEKLPDRHG
jgi:ribosome biogenesis GTPase